MTVSYSHQQPVTMLQKVNRVFREQLKRLGNCFLNKTFDLSVKGSQRRSWILILLFLALGFIFSLRAHPLPQWGEELRLYFQFLFSPSFAQSHPETLKDFLKFTFGAVFSPKTLRYLPLFIFPFIIALQSAATYLADIFEIEKTEIARQFIRQVALTGNQKSIRIANGEVAEDDKDSPIYLIGGPGQVLVELDTAALFEKFNGQPHVIGPTVKGKAKLEGFERFRQALDLRDQYTDPLIVTSRSLDGVPVSTTDVRMVFSVWRGDQQTSAESPYPFSEKAIKSLVYGQSSRVVLEGPEPSIPPTSWLGTIQGLIRNKLGGFMSKYRLAIYLASIGLPEIEQARQREYEIVKVGQTVVAEDDSLEPRNIPAPPHIQPRTAVSNLFSQFAEDFTKNASNRGVELGWIGVGTWKTPSEIVPEKHLEAWRLNRENIARGSKGALFGLQQESQLQHTLRLIQNIPLARFQQNKSKGHKDTVQELLLAYREQLIETTVLLTKSNREVPPAIPEAIKYIESILGIKHWVREAGSRVGTDAPGSSSISAPVLPGEDELYQDLLQKTGQDIERAERLLDYERDNAPNVERIELIQRAINRWLKNNR